MWNLDSVDRLSSRTFRKFLHGNYRNLGVYVDTRCAGYNYTAIYSEVRETTFRILIKEPIHVATCLGRGLEVDQGSRKGMKLDVSKLNVD